MGTIRPGENLPAADMSGVGAQARDELVAVYLAKRAALVRFFAARTGSMASAEDLAQELYVKISARTAQPRPENPTAWIYKTASNLTLDHARTARRSAARDTAWRAATVESLADQAVAQGPPADEAVAARQELAQLIAAVEALPPQMGRAFRLHKLQGLSQAQTARSMGISTKAVEKHISAALRALTRALRS